MLIRKKPVPPNGSEPKSDWSGKDWPGYEITYNEKKLLKGTDVDVICDITREADIRTNGEACSGEKACSGEEACSGEKASSGEEELLASRHHVYHPSKTALPIDGPLKQKLEPEIEDARSEVSIGSNGTSYDAMEKYIADSIPPYEDNIDKF